MTVIRELQATGSVVAVLVAGSVRMSSAKAVCASLLPLRVAPSSIYEFDYFYDLYRNTMRLRYALVFVLRLYFRCAPVHARMLDVCCTFFGCKAEITLMQLS